VLFFGAYQNLIKKQNFAGKEVFFKDLILHYLDETMINDEIAILVYSAELPCKMHIISVATSRNNQHPFGCQTLVYTFLDVC